MKNKVVSDAQWLKAREQLLAKEKQFTRLRDKLSEARRAIPWKAVTKEYLFDGPKGKLSLSDLFDGRSQLVIYHFMFAPEWDKGCPHCSFWADNFNPNVIHLNHHDVTLAAVSRAPYKKVAAYKKSMSWTFSWVSSGNSDFNYDFHVSFTPQEVAKKKAFYNFKVQDPFMSDREGVSVFTKDAKGRIFHTYSTYARGIDLVNTAYNFLDMTPKGRNEAQGNQYWIKRHNEYK